MKIDLLFVLANCLMIFLSTHILYYDEITSCVETAYIGSLFIGHSDAEISLEKLKETLKILYVLINNGSINGQLETIRFFSK